MATGPPPATPSGQAPGAPRWGLGDVFAGLAVGLLLSSLLASIWLAATGDDTLGLGGRGVAQLGLWTGLVGAVVVASRRKGAGRLGEDFGWRFRPVDLAGGLGAAVGAQLIVVPGVALLLRPLLGDPEVDRPVRDLVEQAEGVGVVGLVLVAAIGAPLVEELFFRGLLLRSLQRRFGTGWAIAGSSVFFGLSHPSDLPVEGQVMVMTALAAFAVVLALLAVRTGRLGPSVVAHAAFNAISLAIAFSA